MRNFRNYMIYQEAMDIAVLTYRITGSFPKNETYALVSQLNRAAVSIASNIAEGSSRNSGKDFSHFLEMALGSAFEVETQLNIAKRIGYINDEVNDIFDRISKLEKQLNIFINKVRSMVDDLQLTANSQQPIAKVKQNYE
ncbi:MAG: four helix bundle protein [Bacteroidaceae bacterium]|nr:four helix bundle protein [Bacteroidaceae bacterium]